MGDSSGAHLREARRRRDALIAVIGEQEAADGQVQVTDVATGAREVIWVGRLVEPVVAAHDARLPLVAW